jgi:hypothetical protein
MGIPLVRNNSVDDINTSIIAIKKELGKGGSSDMGDVNVNVDVKYEVTDTVEDGNSLPVTSQGVYDYVEGQGFTPVDEVEKNNMKAVTSNAVAKSLSYSTTEQKTGGVWIDGKPIYRVVRKIWENGQPVTGYTYSSSIISGPLTQNAETIVNAYTINTGTDHRQAIMATSGENGPGQAFCWFSDNSAYFYYGAYVYLSYAVIEYTKTTD